MTLKQWCKKYSVTARPYGKPVGGSQALAVFENDYRGRGNASWELFHLSDRVVSSLVSGPQVVLVPILRSSSRSKSRFGS